jgi:hypothetical protein
VGIKYHALALGGEERGGALKEREERFSIINSLYYQPVLPEHVKFN